MKKNKNLIYLALLGLGIYLFSKKEDAADSTGTSDVGNDANDNMENTPANPVNVTPSVEAAPRVNTAPDGANVQTFTY
jgi:hypothetical protein